MSAISTHALDATLGRPAANIGVSLDRLGNAGWVQVATGETDNDGRCRELAPASSEGTYRLTFDVSSYFAKQNRRSIYPEVVITFHVDGVNNYHMPLLLSDNSYTTYRGS
jgi:5-hydroxyisourate hydrolase